MVLGNGPQDAQIMIVSDYPTKDELAAKRAGEGACGRLFSNYFRDNGFSYDQVYKTCLIKTEFSWPKGAKHRKEVIHALPKRELLLTVADEIANVKPNVIITAGEISTRFLTGRTPVTKLRGSVLTLSDQFYNDVKNPRLKHAIRDRKSVV